MAERIFKVGDSVIYTPEYRKGKKAVEATVVALGYAENGTVRMVKLAFDSWLGKKYQWVDVSYLFFGAPQ
jgi:hypothetical protein